MRDTNHEAPQYALNTVLHFLTLLSYAPISPAPLFFARVFRSLCPPFVQVPGTVFYLKTPSSELPFVPLLALRSDAMCILQVGTD